LCYLPKKFVPQLLHADFVCIENRPFKYLYAIYEAIFLLFAQLLIFFKNKYLTNTVSVMQVHHLANYYGNAMPGEVLSLRMAGIILFFSFYP